MQEAFYQSESDQPHPGRARELIKAHPEVRQLMVRNPWTALIAVSIVILQTAIACAMGSLGFSYWWLSLLLAFCVGAFANHANYVIIHDATHNLIFRNPGWNKMVAVIADLPNLTPGAMGFRVYHLKHHAHQGDYEYDADLANHWEARLVGNKWYRKAICGWAGFLYLVFAFLFSIGLHPVGARWIQEHYTYDFDQETFSYYGPINRLALNMGYHNEHHDLPSVPWNNLPKLRAMAPEFYGNLKYHSSWSRLVLQFIFDRRYSLYSRVERMKQSARRQTTPDRTNGETGNLDLSARPIRF